MHFSSMLVNAVLQVLELMFILLFMIDLSRLVLRELLRSNLVTLLTRILNKDLWLAKSRWTRFWVILRKERNQLNWYLTQEDGEIRDGM